MTITATRTPIDFKDVKKISTRRVAETLGLFRRSKSNFLCPEHNDHTPSAFVTNRNNWRCRACNAGGTNIDLVMSVLRTSTRQAARWIRDSVNELYEAPPPTPEEDWYFRCYDLYEALICDEVTAPRTAHLELLGRRGIDLGAITSTRDVLRSISDYRALDRFLRSLAPVPLLQWAGLMNSKGRPRFYRHTMLFPVWHDGRVKGIVARRDDESTDGPRYLNVMPRASHLYNPAGVTAGCGRVFLCEGITDTLTMLARGEEAVGVLGAWSLPKSNPYLLSVLRNHEVVVCFDGDRAGRDAQLDSVVYLARLGLDVSVWELPDGQDVNDAMRD